MADFERLHLSPKGPGGKIAWAITAGPGMKADGTPAAARSRSKGGLSS